MPSIGAPELLVVIVLALIIFGPRRLPEIGKTVGKSMREFRRAASEFRAEIEHDLDEEPPAGRRPRARPASKADGDPPGPSDGQSSPTPGDQTTS
jgi:sec-independent protein translocase protein TatA